MKNRAILDSNLKTRTILHGCKQINLYHCELMGLHCINFLFFYILCKKSFRKYNVHFVTWLGICHFQYLNLLLFRSFYMCTTNAFSNARFYSSLPDFVSMNFIKHNECVHIILHIMYNQLQLQLQLYTAKSQYWLYKAGASQHWQYSTNKFITYEKFNENTKNSSKLSIKKHKTFLSHLQMLWVQLGHP